MFLGFQSGKIAIMQAVFLSIVLRVIVGKASVMNCNFQ